MTVTNNTEPIIVLDKIRKTYGAFEALKGIDLRVYPGELFGFLGPNGAGKTTLLRILTGILKPTDGSISIGGYDLLNAPERAKACLGYVPDRPYLYDKLTPLEYFAFLAGLYNVPESAAEARGEMLLKRFLMWDWRNELIESFSHGMKQKIAMCGAQLHDPSIFVVDEPTVGLDPKSVKLAKVFFRELTQRGQTVFMTTHTLSVAEDLCDRIGIIHKGQLVELGTFAELQDRATNPNSDLEDIFLKITEEEEEVSQAPALEVPAPGARAIDSAG